MFQNSSMKLENSAELDTKVVLTESFVLQETDTYKF